MKHRIHLGRILCFASLGLLLPLSLLSRARAQVPRNQPAPAFTLKKLDGKPLSLASLRGKVVLLDFWGPS